jgi:hypothetical protein
MNQNSISQTAQGLLLAMSATDKKLDELKGQFKIRQICKSVIICEDPRDVHGWGNETEAFPAFLVYLGCRSDEVAGYIKTFNRFYRCDWCEVRKPRHLKEFEAEIKIRGMQRETDGYAFGLDYLVESQMGKYGELDTKKYVHDTTSYLPRW